MTIHNSNFFPVQVNKVNVAVSHFQVIVSNYSENESLTIPSRGSKEVIIHTGRLIYVCPVSVCLWIVILFFLPPNLQKQNYVIIYYNMKKYAYILGMNLFLSQIQVVQNSTFKESYAKRLL